MSTFNPTTGCAGTLCPPFNSDQEFEKYKEAVQKAGVLQSVSVYQFENNETGQPIKLTEPMFPAVQIVTFGKFDHYSPSVTLAIVYINPSGKSMFAYRNDPANQISLLEGGSQIAPQIRTPIQDVAKKTGTPKEVWILLIVVIILLVFGVGLYFYFKTKSG